MRREVVVRERGVEKPRVPMETERVTKVTKAMMVRHDEEEMSPEMRAMPRVMPMESMVKSMAAVKGDREFTVGKARRRSQHRHQESGEQPSAICRHAPSPLAVHVTAS